VRALWLGLLGALLATTADAHQAGVSSSRVAVEGAVVEVTIDALAQDYEQAAGLRLRDEASGEVNPVALAVGALALVRYVTAHAVVRAGERSCTPEPRPPRAAGSHVSLRIAWRCPEGALVYRVTLFQAADPAARHVVLLTSAAGESELALDAAHPEVALAGPPAALAPLLWSFFESGVAHIFTGFDHIAFLLAVVLWGRSAWPLVKVVTAFTLAHALTLSLAALGVVSPPPRLVELLIAASIVYAAAENFWSRDVDRRWRTAFGFGLVHGFGFAGVLQGLGLPYDKGLVEAEA
jgi:hydrogenase/urease accessory protein HupE